MQHDVPRDSDLASASQASQPTVVYVCLFQWGPATERNAEQQADSSLVLSATDY